VEGKTRGWERGRQIRSGVNEERGAIRRKGAVIQERGAGGRVYKQG